MIWYSDASFLVSAFGKDGNTPQAKTWLRACKSFPIIVSRLSEFEMDTALRAAVLGRRLSEETAVEARQSFIRAKLEGYFEQREIKPHQWFPQAHRISANAQIESACRALDVLHVAAAVLLKADGFLTFDEAQSKLAEHEGLKVEP